MPTVTTAAVIPRMNSGASAVKQLAEHVPSQGSVPSKCLQLGGAGCSTWSKAYPVTGSKVSESHTVAISMGCARAMSAKTKTVTADNSPRRLSTKMPQPLLNDLVINRVLARTNGSLPRPIRSDVKLYYRPEALGSWCQAPSLVADPWVQIDIQYIHDKVRQE